MEKCTISEIYYSKLSFRPHEDGRICIHNFSNQWKSMTMVFPFIGPYLAMKVGDEAHVRIGANIVIECGMVGFPYKNMIHHLYELGR